MTVKQVLVRSQAREKLEDPDENLGAQMLRQATEKTGEVGDDGTSTATILAHAIYAEGVRNVAAGASAIEMHRIMAVGRAGDTLKIATTDIRRPRRIAPAVESAWGGELDTHYDEAGYFVRFSSGRNE